MNVDLARAIADRVTAVRGVARLSGGLVGGAATYGPGGRIDGVRGHEGRIEIHIVTAGSIVSLPAVADSVRAAVAPMAPGARIDVFVDDLDLDVVDLDALDPVASGSHP